LGAFVYLEFIFEKYKRYIIRKYFNYVSIGGCYNKFNVRKLKLIVFPFLERKLLFAKLIFSLFVVMAMLTSHTLLAQPAPTINYQGKLADSTSIAVANGTYQMEFTLYDAPTGGTTLWSEVRTGGDEVTVTDGLFSVMLGEVTPLTSVDFNQTLYLGVEIESDGEMTPRKVLGTVPAAFQAYELGGVASSSFCGVTRRTL
jgi:hypothetical protein